MESLRRLDLLLLAELDSALGDAASTVKSWP